MFKKLLFVFLLITAATLQLQATHIVGGEIYYRYLPNGDIEIRLTVYRDCYFGEPPFDNPASIGIFNSSNVLVQNLFIWVNDSATVDPIINSPCFIPPVDVCYRVAHYIDTISLPLIPGGYQLSYQRCCRNQTIINIVNPLATGATFYANIPGFPVQNGNPVFDSLPPPFICASLPFEFDHGATDPDGDSLVYELCDPFDGATQGNPAPQPPFNPPYQNIIWQPPYNTSNLLGGVPLTIDPQTGWMTATPNTVGQFVIGVCVNEYRNGILLSKTRRDYQLNVVPCPTLVVAAIQSPIISCGSDTVLFQNTSFGASTYFWNFGDPTTLGDTSKNVHPIYVYPDTGMYFVTLIAYSSFNPSCADTTIDTVLILRNYLIDFSFGLNPCSFTVSFNDTSNSQSGVTSQWLWNFGDNTTATIPDPVHTFPGPGTYTVTLQATSERGCKETIVKTVIIPPQITATAIQTPVSCFGDCDGEATVNVLYGIAPFQYQWDDSLSQTTQTATGLCPGTYQVTVTDSNGCTTTTTVNVGTPNLLNSSVSSTDAYCNGLCIGTASVLPTGGTTPYSITWNDPQSQTGVSASGLCPGWYVATITDDNGCQFVDSVEVIYSTFIPALNATISDDTIFSGQTVQLFANTLGIYTYTWFPPGAVSNPSIQNPTATPTENTTYIVSIVDTNGCENIDSVNVVVKEVICEEPEIFIPNAFTPNGDSNNDRVYVRGNTIKELDFRIFNRWGEKVFETNDPSTGWDGYFNGKLATPAVYVYYVDAVCFDNQKYFKKGNITLIR